MAGSWLLIQVLETLFPIFRLDETSIQIVVLPFVNMSDDPAQEFFSDGISEELLNLLSKIQELRVISRTSAFYFKGKDVDILTIAERLKVDHVLAGSVRKAGNRVRVTAQLIDVRTDTHPEGVARIYAWTGQYDLALEWLEKLVEMEGPEALSRLADSGFYSKLARDPRFDALLRKHGQHPDPYEAIPFKFTPPGANKP